MTLLICKCSHLVITSLNINIFNVFTDSGLIFGLSEEQSKNAILALSRKVFINAEARRHGKAGIMVRVRQAAAVDSDDYSDSELNEPISDSSEEESEEEMDEDEDMQSDGGQEPPRKIAKV